MTELWIFMPCPNRFEPPKSVSYLKPSQNITKEQTNRAVKILDAKYEKADLPQIFHNTCSHLKESKKLELLSLL